jgi:hypothetical protein
MNMDFTTLCLLGILIAVAAIVLPRLINSMGQNYSQRGSERPRYDDPDVRSGGGFAGGGQSAPRGNERPNYDDPDIRSGGGFGGSNSSGGGFRLPFGTRGSSGRSRGGSASGTMRSGRGSSSGFGRAMGGSKSGGTASSGRQSNVGGRGNDDPDVRSGGGFGGSGS